MLIKIKNNQKGSITSRIICKNKGWNKRIIQDKLILFSTFDQTKKDILLRKVIIGKPIKSLDRQSNWVVIALVSVLYFDLSPKIQPHQESNHHKLNFQHNLIEFVWRKKWNFRSSLALLSQENSFRFSSFRTWLIYSISLFHFLQEARILYMGQTNKMQHVYKIYYHFLKVKDQNWHKFCTHVSQKNLITRAY